MRGWLDVRNFRQIVCNVLLISPYFPRGQPVSEILESVFFGSRSPHKQEIFPSWLPQYVSAVVECAWPGDQHVSRTRPLFEPAVTDISCYFIVEIAVDNVVEFFRGIDPWMKRRIALGLDLANALRDVSS